MAADSNIWIVRFAVLFIGTCSQEAMALLTHKGKEFYLQPNPLYGPTRLSGVWLEPTLLSCIASCMLRFADECQSIIYNHETLLCTPGQWLSPSQDKPTPEEGDLYITYQCDPSQGFRLYTYGSTRACVRYDASFKNYTDAAMACKARDSYLYVVKNMDKYYLLRSIFQDGLWVGLNDIDKEGIYIWSDDQQVYDMSWKDIMFKEGEPNDYLGGEDCVAMLLPPPYKLNDDSCNKTYHSVCEKTV